MNNLTQNQKEAKEAYLNKKLEQMLALYKKADREERNAIIRQLDSFLSVVSKDERIFWLKFRRKLEILNEDKVLFPLGQVFITPGAREALKESNQEPMGFLEKHQAGDWGDICQDDMKENDLSVKEGFRILSAYRTEKGEKIWIISEADRNSTTVLLPSEY